MFKKEIRGSIWALILLSAGGLLLHIRIHPPTQEFSFWIPVACGALSLVALPAMFNYRATAAWAYLLNIAIVAIGTVTMASYSVEHWEGKVTLDAVLLKSTLADILVLAAKLPTGQQILRHFRKGVSAAQP